MAVNESSRKPRSKPATGSDALALLAQRIPPNGGSQAGGRNNSNGRSAGAPNAPAEEVCSLTLASTDDRTDAAAGA
jgi:hypothetical protein